jgi:hypothetical protein
MELGRIFYLNVKNKGPIYENQFKYWTLIFGDTVTFSKPDLLKKFENKVYAAKNIFRISILY